MDARRYIAELNGVQRITCASHGRARLRQNEIRESATVLSSAAAEVA